MLDAKGTRRALAQQIAKFGLATTNFGAIIFGVMCAMRAVLALGARLGFPAVGTQLVLSAPSKSSTK